MSENGRDSKIGQKANLGDSVVLDHKLEADGIPDLSSDVCRIIVQLIRPSDNNVVHLRSCSSGGGRAGVGRVGSRDGLSASNCYCCGDRYWCGARGGCSSRGGGRGGGGGVASSCGLECSEVIAGIDY